MAEKTDVVQIGDFNELKTQDTRYSRSTFLKYSQKTFGSIEKGAMHGEHFIDGVITRFHNGLIHGGTDIAGEPQPAIILPDGHTEWWDTGVLHRDEGPAVISKFGEWEEFWTHGTLVMIRAKGEITVNPSHGT
jgi:hypothetical protein